MGDRGYLINIEAFKKKLLNLLFFLISSNPKLFTKGDLLGPWKGVWSLARILRKNWVKSTCPVKRFCQPFLLSEEGVDSISDCYCCCCCCWWWQLWVRWKEMVFFFYCGKNNRYYFNHIFQYSWVPQSTLTLSCNSHHHPSPDFFTFLNWKCSH